MKHVAMYLRVSKTRGQDTRSQKPDLERWATAQDAPVKWYSDRFTGKTMDRPGWNALESDIAAGKVSAVCVWRIDRLGRTAKGLTGLVRSPTGKQGQPYQSRKTALTYRPQPAGSWPTSWHPWPNLRLRSE